MDFFPRAGLKGCASDAEAPARPALGQLWFASPGQEPPAHTPVAPIELNAASSTAAGFSIPSRHTSITPHGYPLAIRDLHWFPWGQSLTLQITEPGLT